MREKLISILAFLLIFTSCDFTSADEYFNQASEYEENGNYEMAIVLLDKAIDKKSNFRPALLNRGNDKTELGQYEQAIIDFKKILEFDPDNTFALFNIANNLSLLENPNKAIEFYSQALETKGALPTFININGGTPLRINIDLKEFDSDEAYEMIDCEIYFERGIEFLKIEEFDKAISDINKSLKVKNAEMDCYFLLGKAYLGKKDSINACGNFMNAAKLGDKEAREMLKKLCIEK